MKKAMIRKISQGFAFGSVALLFSIIAGGFACCAVWLFCLVPAVGGYVAVLLFALALLAAAAALLFVYICGDWIANMQDGKYSK